MREKSQGDINQARKSTDNPEVEDKREMTYADLAERYGISENRIKKMEAAGIWVTIVVEIYLERMIEGGEGNDYNSIKAELAENMEKMDKIQKGSDQYNLVMNVLSQTALKAVKKDGPNPNFTGVDIDAGIQAERKRKERLAQKRRNQ